MIYRLLADGVVLVHLAFVAFVVLGGLLVARWPRVAWLHLPSTAWGAFVELGDRLCPLTPLELRLRTLAGDAGYGGGFVEHYVVALLYPPGLTPDLRVALGVLVLVVNGLVYAWVCARALRSRRHPPP